MAAASKPIGAPLLMCLLGGLAAGGCATAVPVRPQGVVAGNQGGAWEVVLPLEPTARELAVGPEYSRRDEALNYQPAEPLIGLGAWPEPYAPSLDQARTLFLPRNADRQIYFSAFPVYRLPFRGVFLRSGPVYFGPTRVWFP